MTRVRGAEGNLARAPGRRGNERRIARTLENFKNGLFIFGHALNYKISGRRVPLMISLCTTNRCNLRCPFCYAGIRGAQATEYATAELLAMIDRFCDLGTRIFLLQGGEPTLRKDIATLIGRIKERGRYCRMSTNGILVAPKIGELTGLDMISFSLDGAPEITEGIRGKGVYQAVLRGMEAASEAGVPFEIHTVLIRESAGEASIRHVLELAERYGVYVSFCVSAVSGARNTTQVGSADLSREEVHDLYRLLTKLKREGLRVSNSRNSLNKTLSWPLPLSEIGYPDNLPRDYRYVECKLGELIAFLDGDYRLRTCPSAYCRPEGGTAVEDLDVSKAWLALAGKSCVACGGSDESTHLFSLSGLEDLLGAFKHLVRK